jgi:hypothetical protein
MSNVSLNNRASCLQRWLRSSVTIRYCVVGMDDLGKVRALCICRATLPAEGHNHEFKHRTSIHSSNRTGPLTRTCTPTARDSDVHVVSAAFPAGAARSAAYIGEGISGELYPTLISYNRLLSVGGLNCEESVECTYAKDVPCAARKAPKRKSRYTSTQ